MKYDIFLLFITILLGILLACQGLVLIFNMSDGIFIALAYCFCFLLGIDVGVILGNKFVM